MQRRCNLNEDFFTQDSKEVFYILGLSVKSYTFSKDSRERSIFRNKNYNIIKMIHACLESNHKIISDNRGKNSYFFEVRSKRLRLSLEERGLTEDKRDRIFLRNIPEEFICDHIRGVIENECGSERIEVITKIFLRFNYDYLVELDKKLRYYANIQKKETTGDFTQYGIQDTKKIYDFIYSEDNRLYIQEIKEKFRLNESKIKRISRMKIEEAKRLLNEGDTGVDIAKTLGYSSPFAFYNLFKKYEGIGTKKFKKTTKN